MPIDDRKTVVNEVPEHELFARRDESRKSDKVTLNPASNTKERERHLSK